MKIFLSHFVEEEELDIQASDEILSQIAAQSSGDARRALSILERIAPSVADGVLTQEVWMPRR